MSAVEPMAEPAAETQPLLSVEGLRICFTAGRSGLGLGLGLRTRRVEAVRGVSFEIAAGQTFGLVGESGSGKSTTGRAIVRLVEPTAGTVRFEGREVTAFGRRTPDWYRQAVQVVFQDPLSSLNPRRVVSEILIQALRRGPDQPGIADAGARQARLRELLDQVGLAAHHVDRYPYELSGGQRQRVAIARALAVRPKLIICDEAVSALDVSTQSQVINLLVDLQNELGVSYLFIAHDLAVVRHVSHRIGVMQAGSLVEAGPADEVYERPKHPYTRALLDAAPLPDPREQRRRRAERLAAA